MPSPFTHAARLAVLALTAHATASTTGMDYTGSFTPFTFFAGSMYGFHFRATNDIAVTALGMLDPEQNGIRGDAFRDFKEVGLFNNTTQTWLAIVQLRTDGFGDGRYWFQTLEQEIVLNQTDTYAVVASVPTTNQNRDAVIASIPLANAAPAADIQFISSANTSLFSFNPFGTTTLRSSVVNPVNFTSSFGLGGNFQYRVVPTPGAAALLTLGALTASRRRRA